MDEGGIIFNLLQDPLETKEVVASVHAYGDTQKNEVMLVIGGRLAVTTYLKNKDILGLA
jgi:hypothetical protein